MQIKWAVRSLLKKRQNAETVTKYSSHSIPVIH